MKSKKKKRIIIGIIIAVILISIVSNVIKAKNQPPELDYDIGKIERQTLRNYISCSGNVRTEESKNVTSVLVGSKINSVNVKVGDTVEVGDSLITFDTELLRKSANDLASSINAAKEQTNISINSADRAVQDAENARSFNLDQLKAVKDQAQSAYDSAVSGYTDAINQLNSLNTQIAGLGAISDQYKNAQADVATKQAAYTTAETAYNQAVEQEASGVPLTGGLTVAGLQAEKDAANSALLTSKANLTALEPKYQQYTALTGQLAAVKTTVGNLQGAMEQTKSALEQAEKNYNNTSSNLDSAILSAKDAAASSRISAGTSTLTLEEQLASTNKQLEEGNLKSTVSGTVTAVNVKKGDTYQGGTLLTIEGVESFIIEANIDEYDVADIKEGMEAIIKTDATREEELSGKVIFVAPSSNEAYTTSGASGNYGAAMSGTSGGSNATYKVKVEVLTTNDRLRLGMSAKVSIITEKAEDVLTVPYDAVTEKEDGTKVITVLNEDDTQTEIEVEVGLESGYYSEIKSDKISEGMQIILPKVNGSSTLDDLLETMGATGGIE